MTHNYYVCLNDCLEVFTLTRRELRINQYAPWPDKAPCPECGKPALKTCIARKQLRYGEAYPDLFQRIKAEREGHTIRNFKLIKGNMEIEIDTTKLLKLQSMREEQNKKEIINKDIYIIAKRIMELTLEEASRVDGYIDSIIVLRDHS
ncbi:MAG: hypothetical protein FVQ80_13845 [Planctomycetes bacterium]|nr:hypothetical protein [Planctomycetota bacterium]